MGCKNSKQTATAPKSAEVQASGEKKIVDEPPAFDSTFDFELTVERKPDDTCGLEVDWPSNNILRVKEVKDGGIIFAYNSSDAKNKLNVGDIIVSVNGVCGDHSTMLEQLQKKKTDDDGKDVSQTLVMQIKRGPTAEPAPEPQVKTEVSPAEQSAVQPTAEVAVPVVDAAAATPVVEETVAPAEAAVATVDTAVAPAEDPAVSAQPQENGPTTTVVENKSSSPQEGAVQVGGDGKGESVADGGLQQDLATSVAVEPEPTETAAVSEQKCICC